MSALKITGPGRGDDAWASMVDGCELVAIRAGRVGVLFLRSRSLDVMLVSESFLCGRGASRDAAVAAVVTDV